MLINQIFRSIQSWQNAVRVLVQSLQNAILSPLIVVLRCFVILMMLACKDDLRWLIIKKKCLWWLLKQQQQQHVETEQETVTWKSARSIIDCELPGHQDIKENAMCYRIQCFLLQNKWLLYLWEANYTCCFENSSPGLLIGTGWLKQILDS